MFAASDLRSLRVRWSRVVKAKGDQMFRRVSIIVFVVTSSLVTAFVGAPPAAANKPLHITSHRVDLICDLPGITTENGTVVLTLEDDSEFGTSGSILYWVPPETPENSPDSTYRTSSLAEEEHITRTGYHFDAVMGMEDRDFNPVGDAVITADLVPTGQQEGPAGKSRFGNRTIRDDSVTTFLVVESGTVSLQDGNVFDLSGCPGFETTIDFSVSDPSQFVISFSGILVLCDIVTRDYGVSIGASTDPATSVQVFYGDANGTLFGYSEDITLTADEFKGTIPLSDDYGEPAGEAVVDVTFTKGDRLVVRAEDGGIRSTRTGDLLEPSGTFTFPAATVDASSCFAFDGREQQKEHRPKT
jgi:hypothetical protein